MRLLLILLQSFLFIFAGHSKSVDKERLSGDIKFVSVFFRHGDRTPTYFYPNDPYKNMSYWPEGFAQLTNIGKQQEFELGRWLRQRYNALLTEKYSPDLIFVQSTDVDRTIMSAQCALAGMYPPKGVQVWNDHLQWQPTSIHTVPANLDNMFTGYAPCPVYDEEYKQILKSKEIEKLNEKYAEVYKVLNENTGEYKHGLKYIYDIYSTLFVENLKNLSLPEWTKPIFPHPMHEAVSYTFTLASRTKKLARFKAGLMIQSMIADMKDKKQGKSRNVHIYSGHETTVATLMNALGVFDLHNPPYAACLMVEMWEGLSGNNFVKIFYRNSTVEGPHLLTIPGCTSACPLDQFISITLPLAITSEQWDKECGRKKGVLTKGFKLSQWQRMPEI